MPTARRLSGLATGGEPAGLAGLPWETQVQPAGYFCAQPCDLTCDRAGRAREDQTETGFSSAEPAAWQKVCVSVVVWPFLVAVSSIGRHVLPSARLVLAPTGLA